MSLKISTINCIKKHLKESKYIVVGAGSGLSTSAGLEYGGKRFYKYFSDFIKKYNYKDMYTAAFYNYEDYRIHWAYWSRHIYYNRYEQNINNCYSLLKKILEKKDYFIITTNVDHVFQNTGFDKSRLFYTQGDYGLFQCAKPCHNKTYDNKEIVIKMLKTQKDMMIDSSLIPLCQECNGLMDMNLRKDYKFVEDEGWNKAKKNYIEFIEKTKNEKTLFLELGVGLNTPSIIKYPFFKLTKMNQKSFYISINKEQKFIPESIKNRSILINDDIRKVFKLL